jgi:hypothetical protein
MYTVIFLDTKGPAKLGTYADKGLCRRAWRTCNAGAAILGPDGALLECKSGTTAAAEKKLTAYAEHLRRQGGMATEAAPARRAAPVAVVEVEEEGDEDERDAEEEDETLGALAELDEAPAPAPPPPNSTTVKPVPVAAPPPPVAVEHARAAETFHAVAALVHDEPVAVAPRPAEVTPARCGAKGCDAAPGVTRSNTNPLVADFCPADRKVAHDRSRGSLSLAEAAKHLRAGTLPPPDPARQASGRKGGTAAQRAAAPKRAAKVVAHRDPKPTHAPSPARTLAAGLERVRRHAAVVDALGGVEAAEQLAAAVRDAGGAAVVVEALTELRSVA